MKKLTTSVIFLFLVFISKQTFSNSILIEINGNNYTDNEVILSLIKDQPTDISEEYSNYIIKSLDDSLLFEDVSVQIIENKYIINITEYANINKILFRQNERLDDEELEKISNELKLINTNPISIDLFINEITKIYNSFGYNNIDISHSKKLYKENNTADIYFDFNEGKITKINKIIFNGNNSIDTQILKSIIQSKTKNLRNIFANNNFKKFVVENDLREISNLYKNKGFIDVSVDYKVEYLKSNKVNVYFEIVEGDIYKFSSITYLDNNKILNTNLKNEIKVLIDSSMRDNIYSLSKIKLLKNDISDLIIDNGIEFFEINSLEKKLTQNVELLFDIKSIRPKYANQINIYGNSRTFDYVIRRELELAEGDPIYDSQIERVSNKLKSLNLFKSVEIVENELDNNLVNLEINVEEKQTGTVNAGVSVGTLDGFAVIAGLSERNFYGTGRSLKALINTSEDKTEFTFQTNDRLFYENDVDINYKANFKEEDFSKTSSYNLDTFSTGVGLGYNINQKIRHNINLDYVIKDYAITNNSTVSSSILNSAGENVSFILRNNLFYSTLNSTILPKNGISLNFNNFIETPMSSSNGFFKNILTIKSYKTISKNTFSFQSRLGNITTLSNNDILTDDKFSLGGRWLRGFDSFGAGPRNSRTSYVGGNNIIVSKLDYSRELFNNKDFPIFLNIFNDYGLLWENKTTPTNSDNNIRASVGFGIKYYSPIGPIGFSWGFPIMDEEYDINRMFLFSVGNLD